MRESRTYGSVRGAPSNGRPYRDRLAVGQPEQDRRWMRSPPRRPAAGRLFDGSRCGKLCSSSVHPGHGGRPLPGNATAEQSIEAMEAGMVAARETKSSANRMAAAARSGTSGAGKHPLHPRACSRFVLATILLAVAFLCSPARAQPMATTAGEGTQSCESWLAARHNGQADAKVQWLLGFLSGAGAVGITTGLNPLQGTSNSKFDVSGIFFAGSLCLGLVSGGPERGPAQGGRTAAAAMDLSQWSQVSNTT